MIRLLRAELARLRSRRLTWIALLLVLLVVGGLQVAVYQSVRPLTTAEIAEGQAQFQQAQRDYQQNRADYEESEKDCVAQGLPADQCSSEPKIENYTYRTPATFAEIAKVVVTVSVLVTSLAILLVSASFIGAEYSSGSLSNWLSFVPERGKVFASKLLAVVLASAVVSAVASGLTLALGAAFTQLAGAPITDVTKVVELAGRGVLLALICAVIGFCLAMLTRHTIAAAGAILGYLLVAYVLEVLSYAISGLQAVKAWLPESNLLAVLNHGYSYYTYNTKVTVDGSEPEEIKHVISFAHGAGYWAVLVVVVIALTFAVFRRRDVN